MPRVAPPLLHASVFVAVVATLALTACQSTGSSADPRTIVEIDAGNYHTCARLENGTVECWGQCIHQCGMRPQGASERLPVVGLQHAVELAVGDNHGCARLDDGTVSCWGYNSNGGLGRPTPEVSLMPLVVPELDGVVEIAIGGDLTCARRADATVTCWGRAARDYENSLDATARRMPARVDGIADARALAVDGARACAQVGAPYQWSCWAWDPAMGPGRRDARFDGAGEFSDGVCRCLRTSEGTIRCTGTGILSAQLADGSSPPVQLHECPADGLTDVAQMVDHCAIMKDRTVRCWGDTPKPKLIEGVTDVETLAVGGGHACALAKGGVVTCWGTNGQGQIDGTPSDSNIWPPRRLAAAAGLTDKSQ